MFGVWSKANRTPIFIQTTEQLGCEQIRHGLMIFWSVVEDSGHSRIEKCIYLWDLQMDAGAEMHPMYDSEVSAAPRRVLLRLLVSGCSTSPTQQFEVALRLPMLRHGARPLGLPS